jgi:spore coat protein U-like protein
MRLSAISALAGAALLAGVSPALALTATGTFDVQVNVTASCVVDTPPTTVLDFGNQFDFSADIDQVLTINVTCTNGLAYDVSLNNGLNASRRMRQGATTNYVDYELYTDAGYTSAWPTTAGSTPFTGDGTSQDIDVYARIPTQATPVAGAYTDTVQITVTY